MGSARTLRLAGLVGFILGLFFVAPVSSEAPARVAVRGLVGLLLLTVLAAGLAAQLRLAARDGDRRIDGLVAAIAAVLAAFAYAFYALETHDPGQVDGLSTRVDALYFSATTTMTIGYGDIHATGQLARVIVLVQMAFNVVFVATAAALLTSRVRRAAEQRVARTRPAPPRAEPPGGPRRP